MKHRHLDVVIDGRSHVAVVTLDRPEVHNALNDRLRIELSDTFLLLRDDDHVRSVVLTGRGDRSFSTGADLPTGSATYGQQDFESYARDSKRVNAWYPLLATYPKPFVTAVNGYAAGSGMQLALTADIVIASLRAQFWIPQLKMGLSPHLGTLVKLSRAIGHQRAMNMALTGMRINADVALAWGLISEVSAPEGLLGRATEIAEQLATLPTLAVQVTKEAMRHALSLTDDQVRVLDDLKSFGMISTKAWRDQRSELARRTPS